MYNNILFQSVIIYNNMTIINSLEIDNIEYIEDNVKSVLKKIKREY